jgi:outer membrane protein, multidrug efflux system
MTLFPLGKLLKAIFLATLLAACAPVGPNYAPPETAAPPQWDTPLKGGLVEKDRDYNALSTWWKTLDDPVLTNLVERAVSGNLDLKSARSRVREARARRGVSEAKLYPAVDAAASATRNRLSESRFGGDDYNLYSAGFDAGWEIDVFGGIRRSIEAATADLEAEEASLRDVMVSLLSEVALNYLDVRTFQLGIEVAVQNLQAQERSYRLALSRFEAGLTNELSVQQAGYNMESTRSKIPILRTALAAAMNRLSVLLGLAPGTLNKQLKEYAPIPVPPLKVAVGVPAEVLRRRPDIRFAERQLAAQTAQVGVATADLYPKFSLVGSIGLETLSLGNVFSASGLAYLIGPSITWPVFNAGAIRSNIEVQTERQEQALIQYEYTILTALEEVENAMVAYAREQDRMKALKASARAAKRAVLLSESQYQAGLTDFTGVLDAQRSLLSFQEQLAKSRGNVTSNLVRLYKALGGGWTSFSDEPDAR